MQAVVTGASGFIGSHLVDGLLAAGYRVKALGRNLPGLIGLDAQSNPNLALLPVSLADRLALQQVLEGVEIVFHLASGSLPQSSNRDPYADVQVNLLGSLNLLEASRLTGVKRLVMVSSGGTVYGIPSVVPIPESHPTDPICSYGTTKLAIEKFGSLSTASWFGGFCFTGSQSIWSTPTAGCCARGCSVFLGKALRHEPLQIWGDGSTVRDFLDVADVVSALLAAANYQGDESSLTSVPVKG